MGTAADASILGASSDAREGATKAPRCSAAPPRVHSPLFAFPAGLRGGSACRPTRPAAVPAVIDRSAASLPSDAPAAVLRSALADRAPSAATLGVDEAEWRRLCRSFGFVAPSAAPTAPADAARASAAVDEPARPLPAHRCDVEVAGCADSGEGGVSVTTAWEPV